MIQTDTQFLANEPSTPERRQRILSDLHIASQSEESRQALAGIPLVARWLALNQA